MIFLILFWIQMVIFFFMYFTMIINKTAVNLSYNCAVLVGAAVGGVIGGGIGVIGECVCLVTLGADLRGRRHLSQFFRGWQSYICIVLVPSIIATCGVQGSSEGMVLCYDCYHLADKIKVALCITPILLILLLTTADDLYSSRSHKELVRNLSILMVADLFDALEMLTNAFESSLGAFNLSTIFLVIGAIITVIVSSLQIAEYEFIEGVEGEASEQIRYKPNVFLKIVELVTNLVALTIRLEVLIVHGKCRATVGTVVIFKNFAALILSVMHICSLTPPAQALKD